MSSTKPYLIRALYEWCADQGHTPYLSIAVDARTRVPREFVKNGEIVLNIGAEATQGLVLGNEEITFKARFSGRAYPVVVPIDRVAAIYARENGEGMAFPIDEAATDAIPVAAEEPPSVSADPDRPSGRPVLTRIK